MPAQPVSPSPADPKNAPTPGIRRLLVALAVILAISIVVFPVACAMRSAANADAESQAAAAQAAKDLDKYAQRFPSWKAPDMVSILGKSSLDAIEAIGHGAAVRDDTVGYDAKAPEGVKRVTVALADVRSKDGSEAPTVVLWVKNGRVIQAVYSSSMRSFGFLNSLTFSEAIEKARVIELGLRAVGADVDREVVSLPADEAEYSEYLEDGRTLEREHVEYEGESSVGNLNYGWIASLDYDYSEAIQEGNLVYTHRVLSVGARIL